MVQKISLMLGVWLPKAGDMISCNGRLYKGLGQVVTVRTNGEPGYNAPQSVTETYPHILVRPDGPGNYRAGNLIRYNADDILNGAIGPFVAAPAEPAFARYDAPKAVAPAALPEDAIGALKASLQTIANAANDAVTVLEEM